MTVSAQPRRVSYTGNGITTEFAVPFQFLEIAVYLDGILLTVGADYTITQTSPGATGSVELAIAPVSPEQLVVIGATTQTQGVDLVDNDSAPAETYELSLDRLTMALQENTLAQSQTLRAPQFAAPLPALDFAANPGAFVHVDDDGVVELATPEVFLGPFANAAAASAASAEEDALAAALALFEFRARYLGAATSNPTLDDNGNAVTAGAFYYNTSASELRFYNGAVWVAVQQAGGGGGGGVSSADSVTFVPAGGISANQVQAALEELDTDKLAVAAFTAAYTAADVLAKLLTVDGNASGLNATTLQGLAPSAFQGALGYTPVNLTRVVGTSGLATGGGNLGADRTIAVTKASQALAEAGADDTTAMTPLRTAQAIAALTPGVDGGLTLLGTVTASSPIAQFNFTGDWSSYKELIIVGAGLSHNSGTAGIFTIAFSANAGSSFVFLNGGVVNNFTGGTGTLIASSDADLVASSMDNSTKCAFRCTISPSNVTGDKSVSISGSLDNGLASISHVQTDGGGAINYIRVDSTQGSFDEGTVRVYGLR